MVQLDNGSIIKVSETSDDLSTNNNAYTPQISGNGNWVVFASNPISRSASDQNHSEIFVYELETETLEKISQGIDGTETQRGSYSPSISNDGNYVAFASDANNLVPQDNNNLRDIFLYNRTSNQIERVSVANGEGANGFSSNPFISGNGNYVVFVSAASNLVPDDTNEETDIFVYESTSGTIERVNLAFDDTQANEYSFNATISDDGRYVAYASLADELVLDDNNEASDIFIYDRVLGTTERVNVNLDGEEANGDSYNASISSNGSYVVYTSEASNLVPDDTNGVSDVFIYNLATDVTQRVSLSNEGTQADGESVGFPSSASSDGRFVAFFSNASNLVADDTNSQGDVFIRDRLFGTTQQVSVSAIAGEQPNDFSTIPSITNDGTGVAFYSSANNLVPDDDNDATDIFVRTLQQPDAAGLNESPNDIQFELDQNVYASGNVLQIIDGSVSDPNGFEDLAGVNFWLYNVARDQWSDLGNATDLIPVPGDSNSASFDYSFILSDLESGQYDVWARGYDRFGELSEQEVIRSFTIDNTISDTENIAPTNLDFNLGQNTIFQGETITALGSIFDSDAADDVALIDFWIYDEALNTWTDVADESTFTLIPTENTATFEYDLTIPELEPGDYILWARGYDFSGEASDNEVVRNFTVIEEPSNAASSQPPNSLEFSLDQTTYTPGATINVQGSIVDSDGASDIAGIDFWLYDQALDSWTNLDNSLGSLSTSNQNDTATFEYDLTIPELDSGEYILWARGSDVSGNLSEEEVFGNFTIVEGVDNLSLDSDNFSFI